ncbi:MAG: ChbG/HpnK family deacetylase [Caldiserica bacterium]|jgi:predicted glycoside hydrolase/deacetylase ChbG (UPF0249 family)|nr:ChbG/HpnK family deacetylase [Caldisericota bacterium]MDH7562133.1 ChbG/HpnK family deacetylase [Caldisericota bacterium]
MRKNKFLFFNADDLGYSFKTNERILAAFLKGPVGGSSLIVNMGKSTASGAMIAIEEGIPVGLHFNVNEGAPLSGAPSLVGKNGKFFPPPTFLYRMRQGFIDPQDLKEECRAQIEEFISLGFSPFRFDSHNHSHVFPGVFPIIAPILKEYGFKVVRTPRERKGNFFRALPRVGRALEILFLSLWGDSLKRNLPKFGFKTIPHFSGMLEQEPYFSKERILRMLKRLNFGLTEIMVHPGHKGEMEVLIDEEINRAIHSENFRVLKQEILEFL